MSDNSWTPTGAAFAWRLAVFYAALFIVLGVQLPFLPIWLAAKGLDATSIGIVLGVPMIVRVFAIPVATRAADRHDALRAVIVTACAAAVLGYGLVGLAQWPGAIIAAFALASCFYTPLMPLADAYALRGLAGQGRSYGPVRMWGSVAFIAGSLGGGFLLDVIAPRDLIWVMVTALAFTAAAACGLAPLGNRRPAGLSGLEFSASRLLRDPAFLAIAAGAGLIQASHAVYYAFSSLQWRAAGLDGATIGALWAVGVIAEIALFAMSARFSVGPSALLMAGAAGAVVRWGAMAFDPGPALLAVLQCLHALSFGATHLGALGFVARLAPPEFGASAQGYLAVALGLVMALAMGISGVLYARWQSHAYSAMALAAGIGGLLVLAGPALKGSKHESAEGSHGS